MAQVVRPVLRDETMKGSAFSSSFIDRVENALSWNQAADIVAHEVAVKTGSIKNQEVKGVNPFETELAKRISAQTQKPENNSTYRTQERINEHQKWLNQNLRDDLARERKYQKELAGYLS